MIGWRDVTYSVEWDVEPCYTIVYSAVVCVVLLLVWQAALRIAPVCVLLRSPNANPIME